MLNEPIIHPIHQPFRQTPEKKDELTSDQKILEELRETLSRPCASLSDFVSTYAFDGGISLFSKSISVLPVFRSTNTSGFNYCVGPHMLAYLRLGVTTSGFFVIQSMILDQESPWVSHYYSADGRYAFTEGPISHVFSTHSEIKMESGCPILNHLYNILAADYRNAESGNIDTKRDHTIERALRTIEKQRKHKLSIVRTFQDHAITDLNQRMNEIENDPIYTWRERFQIFRSIKSERSTIIQTKKRAHKKSLLAYFFPILLMDWFAALRRFAQRPMNNLFGILKLIFIDPIYWFFGMVRKNLGFSVAMAIYSPFTFFFITQPMNPHATWAVGKLRTAYLETTQSVGQIFSNGEAEAIVTAPRPGPSTALDFSNPFSGVPLATSKEKKDFLGIKLSTDIPAIDQQSWDDRMSNFKVMQLTYESNLEAAARLGRLEQIETQLNWPLMIENSWAQTESYLDFLNFVEKNEGQYADPFVSLVKAEKLRTAQTQLYLWDRNVRFILDHPYTVMDQTREQTQIDYYVGRAFIQLREMTEIMIQRYAGLKQPHGFERIMKLAEEYQKNYQPKGGVLTRLKNNSRVFQQDRRFDSDEMREYMKREWEILYILQNRAQEGANQALQMYIGSVRNMAWLIQSTYSVKETDMRKIALALSQTSADQRRTSISDTSFQRLESRYESLYHMMVLEYASISKEMGEALTNDIETDQRKTLIQGLESFFKERENLLKATELL